MAEHHHNIPFRRIDDFILQELIYEGPHTLVFRGYQASLRRAVIVKLLKPHVKNRREWVERFQREARVCAKLKHPNVVDVYALGEKEGYHYITIEYVHGTSLKDLLKNAGSLPSHIAISITDQILQALSFVHQHQIVHRDVKPGNILINTYGQAKLSDFGLAQVEEEPTVTQQGSIIGTPAYMAPEQISGSNLDGRSDLFALGAVIYEMLSGEQAFAGENYSTCLYKIMNETPSPLTELNQAISEEFSGYVEQFLRKSPGERWQDALSARKHLQTLAKQLNIIKTGAEQVAEFIRPFLVDSVLTKSEDIQAKEAVFSNEDSEKKKHPFTHKRWLLFSGGVGATILVALFVAWLKMPVSSILPDNHSQNTVSSVTTDSLSEDSMMASTFFADTTGYLEVEDRKTGRNDHKEPLQLPVDSPRVDFSENTNPGRKAGSNLPAFRDTAALPLTITKTELTTRVNISVEPWAKIMIDGREADSHAVQQIIPVTPGRHTITFVHPNFSPQVMHIDVQDGEQKEIQWSFFENAGFLWVEARPWAEVYIDNTFRDSTPLKNPIALSTGKHLLELKHPRLATHREQLTILSGDTVQVQVQLRSK